MKMKRKKVLLRKRPKNLLKVEKMMMVMRITKKKTMIMKS